VQFAGLAALVAGAIGAVTGFIATNGATAASLVGDSSIRAATMPVAFIVLAPGFPRTFHVASALMGAHEHRHRCLGTTATDRD